MKTPILAILAASSLSACATTGLPSTAPTLTEGAVIAATIASARSHDRLRIAAGVAAEVGARFHCPANPQQLDVLTAARLLFDLTVRSSIAPESALIVDALRKQTNAVCGLELP